MYIGETGDTLSHRMTIYRQHIRHSKVSKMFLSEHIANCAMGLDLNFQIFPLYENWQFYFTEAERIIFHRFVHAKAEQDVLVDFHYNVIVFVTLFRLVL